MWFPPEKAELPYILSSIKRDLENYLLFHPLTTIILYFRKYSKSHFKNICKGCSPTEFDRNVNVFLSTRSMLVQLLVLNN